MPKAHFKDCSSILRQSSANKQTALHCILAVKIGVQQPAISPPTLNTRFLGGPGFAGCTIGSFPPSVFIMTTSDQSINHFTALSPGLVSRYQKKHSPTHHPDHHPIFISFFYLLLWSIASSLFKLRACQSFCTTSLHVLLVYLLVWSPPPHISIHFFTQSVSSFCNTCTHHHNLFWCSIKTISYIPSLSLNSLLGTLSFTLTIHIHRGHSHLY